MIIHRMNNLMLATLCFRSHLSGFYFPPYRYFFSLSSQESDGVQSLRQVMHHLIPTYRALVISGEVYNVVFHNLHETPLIPEKFVYLVARLKNRQSSTNIFPSFFPSSNETERLINYYFNLIPEPTNLKLHQAFQTPNSVT